MAICQTCGAEVPEGFRFCGQCGSQIEPIIESQKEEERATPSGDEALTAAAPAPAAAESPEPVTRKPPRLGWIRSTPGAIITGIIAVVVIGGIVFGLFRYNALTKSTAAYNQAQAEIKSGHIDQALVDLGKVVSYDAHYQDAQKQISTIKQAFDIVRLASTITNEASKYDSNLTVFWSDYTKSIDQLNPAWQNYNISDIQSYLSNAQAPVNAVGNDSSSVAQDVSNLSLCFGSARANSLITGFNTSSLMQDYNDSSEQANAISNAVADELTSLKNNSYAYASVVKDINETNTAFNKLQADQLKVDQNTSQFIGYMMSVAKNLAGGPITFSDVGQSSY